MPSDRRSAAKGSSLVPNEPVPDFSTLPLLMRYRWVPVVFVMFPLLLVFRAVTWFLEKVADHQRTREGAPISRVQKQVRERPSHQRMCTDRPGWSSMSLRPNKYKDGRWHIKMSDFDHIIRVDTEAQIIECEPFVTVAQISKALLHRGWTLPMIPELDDLTVGGLLFGVGVESSSHKHGLFYEFCVAYDIVTDDGTLVHATADNEHSDLFHALPWSYGTLGILVRAHLKIIPAKPYVKLHYYPLYSRQSLQVAMERESRNTAADFVEGLAYSSTHSVLMVGEMTDLPAGEKHRVNNLGAWYKPWFYEYVKEVAFGKGGDEIHYEYIPLRDYYHRHSRSIFWQMRELVPFGNHPLFRLCLGWLMPVPVKLLKLTTPTSVGKVYEQKFVFQDMLMPLEKLPETLKCFDRLFNIYPLWLCPYRLHRRSKTRKGFALAPAKSGEEYAMFIDVGAYGMPTSSYFTTAAETVPECERFVRQNQGHQMLYADCYMSEDEFRLMFDHELYDKVRDRYGGQESCGTIYDKVKFNY
eukprot:TRINITY_DN40281_c0_g1_i1.p1 TRINITY_DN40281_c0_g1~~TRINITY_DN40281_c0_g1_i1.p1  ORF type:complete len:526 (+),score=76.70 TRINITY_DN40281_c0_g1_i1:286-1863(+)